jgi:hypothetical protein
MNARLRTSLTVFAMTVIAVLIHGYHLGVEDAEIYLPAVKQRLNPALYPVGSEFFSSHAHLSLFSNIIAVSIKVTHLPFDYAIFAWHLFTIFLLLFACRMLAERLFTHPAARWAGTALVAALLTIPVAGTSLYIMDQYVTARSLVTPAVMFMLLYALDRRYVLAAIWFVLGAVVHPLMAVFGLSFVLLMLFIRSRSESLPKAASVAALLLPFGISFAPPSPAYREIVMTRSYFFLQKWEWYEWLGAVAPILIFWFFARWAHKHQRPSLELISSTSAIYGVVFLCAAILLIPERFISLTKLQPMRYLHLQYILLFLVAGGLIGEFLLKSHVWRWLVLFVPLCAGMWFSGRELFPATRHVEWPGLSTGNHWVDAFVWIRNNTPVDAVFALDPRHMELPGEDQQGFRVIAERSMLADSIKDSGAVTMFPQLADRWTAEVAAQTPWPKFTHYDFLRLRAQHRVTWVVLQQPDSRGLTCPYRNESLLVCQTPTP